MMSRFWKSDWFLGLAGALLVFFVAVIAIDDQSTANIGRWPRNVHAKMIDLLATTRTDSSRTKTGMVLGTPSYTSPEQLAGKRIEGRSDLFSLAVSHYQLEL